MLLFSSSVYRHSVYRHSVARTRSLNVIVNMAASQGHPDDSEKIDSAKYSERWEIMWNGGSEEYEVKGGDGGKLQPGQSFDAGCSPPHLQTTIESLGNLEGKTAVVPGCGRGYDVETLAKYVASATGLEYSPTAVEEASTYLRSRNVDNARVLQCDFFNHSSIIDQKFDIGYDYTFFCAIHPSMYVFVLYSLAHTPILSHLRSIARSFAYSPGAKTGHRAGPSCSTLAASFWPPSFQCFLTTTIRFSPARTWPARHGRSSRATIPSLRSTDSSSCRWKKSRTE